MRINRRCMGRRNAWGEHAVAVGSRVEPVTLSLTWRPARGNSLRPAGTWLGSDGNASPMALYNYLVDGSVPYRVLNLASLGADPALGIGFVGQEFHAGSANYHLRLFHTPAEQWPESKRWKFRDNTAEKKENENDENKKRVLYGSAIRYIVRDAAARPGAGSADPWGIPPAQTRADSAQPTQPAQPAAATRPEGVPEGYVITPFGYFDPSCVFHVAQGETLLAQGTVLQHADGTVENLPACLYPHYAANGELVAGGATKVESPTVNGWVEYASTTTSSAYGGIVGNWVVPPGPSSIASQTDFFFNGLEDINNVQSIIQPVLQFGASGSRRWELLGDRQLELLSQQYCGLQHAGGCEPGRRHPGHRPVHWQRGNGNLPHLEHHNCRYNLKNSTMLRGSPNEGQTFNWAFGGVLDVYGVTQCADIPPAPTFISITSPSTTITSISFLIRRGQWVTGRRARRHRADMLDIQLGAKWRLTLARRALSVLLPVPGPTDTLAMAGPRPPPRKLSLRM